MRMTLLYYAKDDAGSYIEYEVIEAENYEEAERIGRKMFGENFIEIEEKTQEERRKKLETSKYYR